MAIVATSGTSDSFAVRDTRFEEFDRKFIIILNTPFKGTEVEFALTGNYSLFKFFKSRKSLNTR